MATFEFTPKGNGTLAHEPHETRDFPFRDGDVLRYQPDDSTMEQREGMAIVDNGKQRSFAYAYDTYTRYDRGTGLSRRELESAEVLGNLHDFESFEYATLTWQGIDPADVLSLTYQHGGIRVPYIRIGTESHRIAVAQRDLYAALKADLRVREAESVAEVAADQAVSSLAGHSLEDVIDSCDIMAVYQPRTYFTCRVHGDYADGLDQDCRLMVRARKIAHPSH